MTSQSLTPSLFGRFALSRDLAGRGSQLLVGNPNTFDATQGIVLLDLSLEVAMKTALGELNRSVNGDRLTDLLDALPELAPLRRDVEALHQVRNLAQHRGVAPGPRECAWARPIALGALRALFRMTGADFDTLSSVQQLQSPHLRGPLEQALGLLKDRPADAAALAVLAMGRTRGWVAHITGEALVPEDMWVFQRGLWNDTIIMSKCADKREEYLLAMLTLAAGSAMGIEPPALLRFDRLAHGHRAHQEQGGFRFEHDQAADLPTEDDAAWMVELVARCAYRFEMGWPEMILVEVDSAVSDG